METKENIKQQKTICFVAGKSGGHIIPCLTLAQQMIVEKTANKILFFSSNTALDKTILANKKHVNTHITLSFDTCTLKKVYAYQKYAFNFFISLITSLYNLYIHKPSECITTGGIIAIPVCLAASFLRIPITLYELNAEPGKTITFLAPLATTIYYCFDAAQNYFSVHKRIKKTYPIRFDPSIKNRPIIEIKKKLGLDPNKKTITILGGSQGSVFINNIIKKWIQAHPELLSKIQIIHQTGSHDTTNWQQFYKKYTITSIVSTFTPEPELWYAASDIIVCRSGAGTLFEVAFFYKPCITIPLALDATAHQVSNARAMEQEYPDLVTYLEQKKVLYDHELFFTSLNKKLKL